MRRPRLAWLFLALLVAGCLRQPEQLTVTEAERVAWYVEEVSHGLDADPYELVSEGATVGMRNIALWALGHVEDLTPVRAPPLLEDRSRRWPLLREGLRSGALGLHPSGLLTLTADGSSEDRRLYRDAVEHENIDRLSLTSLLLSRGELSPGSRRGGALVAALRRARLELGLRAGGRVTEPAAEDEEALPVRPSTPRRRM